MTTTPVPPDPATIPKLPVLLSAARLKPYLDTCAGDAAEAIRLYTWNLEVSAAFWGEIHVLEVVLRNSLHDRLVARYRREDWWEASRVKLHHVMKSQLDEAKTEAAKNAQRKGRPQVSGDVIAGLSFGFWTAFIGAGRGLQYETRYWQPALRHAFPNYSRPRSALHKELDSVRLFRNRIAHHEPIFHRHLSADQSSIIRLAGYMDADATSYIAGLSRVPAALSRRISVVQSGVDCSF